MELLRKQRAAVEISAFARAELTESLSATCAGPPIQRFFDATSLLRGMVVYAPARAPAPALARAAGAFLYK